MRALSKSSGLLFKLALVFCGLTFGAYHAASGQTFTGSTSSNWNTASNWSTNPTIPSGATTSVTLNANASISTGSNVTIGNITTSSTAAITLSTSNGYNLTVGSASNGANVTFSKGGELDVNNSIVTIYGNLVINIPTGSTFTLKITNGGTLDIKGGITITGGGNLTIQNNNATLKVAGGITGGTGDYSIANTNGGHFSVGGAISGGTLSLTNNNATFSVAGDIHSTVGDTTISNTNGGGLTSGGAISSAGTLSLTNNNATVSASGGISGGANSSISDTNGGHITSGGAISLGDNSIITDNNATISSASYTMGTGSCVNDSNGGQIINTTTNQTCTSSSCTSPCTNINITLPITLNSFYASLETTSINLKWSTATELNFDYFSLQKSADGTLFKEISHIKGHGTTNEKHDYEFEDNFPFIGKNYYRLTSLDFDNHQETFHVIVQEYQGEKDFQLSPNPSDGQSISLTFNFDESDGHLLIYDNMGSTVAAYGVSEAGVILFENPLKSGIYLAKYTSPSFTKTVRLLVR